MKDWRLDIATLALFTCVGPFLGTSLWSVVHNGWSGLLMPLFLAMFLGFAGSASIVPFLTLLALPAFLSAATGIAVRRAGFPLLFVPAAVVGGWLANIASHYFAAGKMPERYWVMTGLATSMLLAFFDVFLRARENGKLRLA